jgi:hypothetical protein
MAPGKKKNAPASLKTAKMTDYRTALAATMR